MPIDIGFLGLGKMGAAMAERLLAPEIRLHVHDPVAAHVEPFLAQGARAHAAPRAVGDAASIVFACLPSPAISLAVAAAMGGAAALATYVEMSTIGRATMQQVATLLAAHGVAVVDAPISGGPDGARAGRLALMAAGAPAAIERIRPYLDRIASNVFEVGATPGLGQVMKLVNNLIAAANIAASSEALIVGAKAGLDPDTMIRVIDRSSGQNTTISGLMPAYVLNGRFDYGASLGTLLKDVTLGLREAEALALPMPIADMVCAGWQASTDELGREEDLTRYIQPLERRAGVELRSRPPRTAGDNT